MPTVRVSGQLICLSNTERDIVVAHLDRHIALSRNESGCVSFDVHSTADPFV